MKNVEILTANNITIQYETATVMNRGVALFIDYLAKGVYLLIMMMILGVIGGFGGGEEFGMFLIYILIALPTIFYSLVMEYLLKGQNIR